MKGFAGFSDGKQRSVALPEPFFAELLPLVDHLGELKVTLYAFWRLGRKDGLYRFLLREDLAGKTEGAHGKRDHPNHIFTWEAGDKAAADAAFDTAPVTVAERIFYPRVHPCPLETCGCVASFDPVRGELTTYMTSQAPHVVRTVVSLLSGIPESKVRIVSPDIGGGFGNKVGVYPGYVCRSE